MFDRVKRVREDASHNLELYMITHDAHHRENHKQNYLRLSRTSTSSRENLVSSLPRTLSTYP